MAQILEGGSLVVTGISNQGSGASNALQAEYTDMPGTCCSPQAEEITTEAKKSVAIEYSHRLLVDDRVPLKRSPEPPLLVRRIARRLH